MNACSDKRESIIDAECLYDGGRFRMHRLPGCLPNVFTVRFIAPADFKAGDVVVVNNIEMPVKTPGMTDAGDGLFSAGAVLHCEIDLDRNLAFINAGFGPGSESEPGSPDCECYYPRVNVYIETDGDDDGDGSPENPLQSIHGLFALLGREYRGYIKVLCVYMGRGAFDAPRDWFNRAMPFTVESAYFYGKNAEDNNPDATIVGDKGIYVYADAGLGRVCIVNASIRCSDDSMTSVIAAAGSRFRMSIYGICNIVNAGTVKKRGIDGAEVFIVAGASGAPSVIAFKGDFTDVIYNMNQGAVGLVADCKMVFDGTSTHLIYMNGCSSLYCSLNIAPEFRNGFKGNIRAYRGSTIAITTGISASQLLPAGSQWIKDDTSRITGQ